MADDVLIHYQEMLSQLLSARTFPFDKNLSQFLPKEGGVYHIIQPDRGQLFSVYVGKSDNLRRRIYRWHLFGSRRVSTLRNKLLQNGGLVDEPSVTQYLINQCRVQFIVVPDEIERGFFEHYTIAALKPKHNS